MIAHARLGVAEHVFARTLIRHAQRDRKHICIQVLGEHVWPHVSLFPSYLQARIWIACVADLSVTVLKLTAMLGIRT